MRKLKYKMAAALRVRFQGNGKPNFSEGLDGVVGCTTDGLKNIYDNYCKDKAEKENNVSVVSAAASGPIIMHCTINAFQVVWKPLSTPNQTYVLQQCMRYVDAWDTQARRN